MLTRFFDSRYAVVFSYLLIFVVMLLAFIRIESIREERAANLAAQTEERQVERAELTDKLCKQSEISREALRQQIIATAELARSLVPSQTPELIDEVVQFQEEQLAKLPPIQCESNGE